MKYNILNENDWQQQVRCLKKRVDQKLKSYFVNKSNHQKNPIIDFLFEYYSFQFSELKKWSPGVGFFLEGKSAEDFLKNPIYKSSRQGVFLDVKAIPTKRIHSLSWIIQLLENIGNRAPFFGCSGLHEWAMVYRVENIRHGVPLRLSVEKINEFVEKSHIYCSHYDAFRFFTKKAVPLNELAPTKDTLQLLEQPGCLHVNMDLYKWAHKFYPWINSNLIMDTFDFALEIREVDMRASPYDLSYLGYEPILIETSEGRQEYIHLQKKFYEKAQPLRQQLISEYKKIVSLFSGSERC